MHAPMRSEPPQLCSVASTVATTALLVAALLVPSAVPSTVVAAAAATAAAVAALSTASTSSTASGTGVGDINTDSAAIELALVHAAYRGIGFRGRGERYEAEAPRA